ncbi:MAG: diguanylate cyclase [Rhodocyclaceae bacterium]|nr:diguanylate cyclase [Rhodocyclaceae bacterium]
MRILVIEDTLTALTVVCHQLEKLGFRPIPARDGVTGLRLYEQERPDLVLLDVILPGLDGIEVARRIRDMEKESEWTPIIFLTSRARDQDIEEAVNAGGDDYLIKPVSEVVLGAKVRAMQRLVQMRYSLVVLSSRLDEANRELQRLSSVDGLTGIPNRRNFDESLAREWRRCKRGNLPFTVLIADVDFFKQYNDAHGHQSGDCCLRAVAQALAEHVHRPGDLVARYGGEEFGAILPDTDLGGALGLAESMRHAVESLAIPHIASAISPFVTLSIGVASMRTGGEASPEALLRAADQALYAAKRGGRNRIFCQAEDSSLTALENREAAC